jgi:hypothetical protein
VNYRKHSSNSDKSKKHNISKIEKYLESQNRNYNIKYRPEFSPEIEEELYSKKGSDYSNQVHKLIKLTLHYPRADGIEYSDLNFFTYKGFDRPEATHRRSKYDDKEKGYEVWSKDIDEESRLIYRIYDELEVIEFISIIGHDLDSN